MPGAAEEMNGTIDRLPFEATAQDAWFDEMFQAAAHLRQHQVWSHWGATDCVELCLLRASGPEGCRVLCGLSATSMHIQSL